MSSTPDPRYGAVLEILARVLTANADTGLGPYVDELLASVDSIEHAVTGVPDVDVAFLRSQAVDLAVRGGLGYGGAGDLARAAGTILDFLRDGTAPDDPNLGRPAKVDGPSLPGQPGAPAALHEAIDRAWRSIVEDGEHLAVDSDGDEEVLEQLRTLTDGEIARTSFVQAIVRSLAQAVRADRYAGEEA